LQAADDARKLHDRGKITRGGR